MTLTVPFAYLNLDDNMVLQIFSFIILTVIMGLWLIQFGVAGLDWTRVPAVTRDNSGLIGNILFNFAFIVAIPSWVNEKKPDVSVKQSVWGSTLLATATFIAIGLMGPMAYHFGDEDLLSVFSSDAKVAPITKLGVYLFPFIALLSSIPIFSIVVRYNLIESKLCSEKWAHFWSIFAPWIGALVFYSGDMINTVVNWTGLLTVAPLNFILPCWFYISTRRPSFRGKSYDHVEDDEEEDRLPLITGDGNTGSHGMFLALPPTWPGEAIAWVLMMLMIAVNIWAIILELVS